VEDLLTGDGSATGEIILTEQALPLNRLGEPVTFFLVVTASVAAIQFLGTFLMKKRRHTKVRYSIDVEYPDGKKTSQVLELSQSESEAPDAEVIDSLARLTGLPSSELETILRGSS
jgi:hypothetical protein